MKSVKTKGGEGRRARGRPRAFDRTVALERAMQLFWRKGYEATSLSELTEVMGINPPSVYAAFGNKERLFMEVMDGYMCGPGGDAFGILDKEPTARGAMAQLLKLLAIQMTRPGHPPGCMMVKTTAGCTSISARAQAALAKRRTAVRAGIKARIGRGIRDGEMPRDTDAGTLADFYVTVIQGMSIQAIEGATRKRLLATGAAAMRAWPTESTH